MSQNTSYAVMAQRHDSIDGLDYFPTPPWATRALCEHLGRWGDISRDSVWEPACGEGHMARPLAEYFAAVRASDIHDYGCGQVVDFLGLDGLLGPAAVEPVDWVITNPPFNRAGDFVRAGLSVARVGVAMLVRTAFLEGGARYRDLFAPHPPEWIGQFCERVPMVKGRLDRAASSATAYCWVVWVQPARPKAAQFPAFFWFPPGTRMRLERDEDYAEAAE